MSDRITEIFKDLDTFQGYGRREVLEDVVDFGIFVAGINSKFNIGENACDIMERLLKKYGEDGLKKISAIMDKIYVEIKETKSDVLGTLYMQSAPNKNLGQVFTPVYVTEMMARMTIDGLDFSENRYQTIADPCVGSGAMAIGCIRAAKENADKLLFFLNDLDMFCCKMATLQMEILGAKAIVTCANALTDNLDYDSLLKGKYLMTSEYYSLSSQGMIA